MNRYRVLVPELPSPWFKKLWLGQTRATMPLAPGHGPVLAGLALIGLMVLMALLSPWIAPYNPAAQDTRYALAGPSARHWLGTDELGRNILSRITWGTRISMAAKALGEGQVRVLLRHLLPNAFATLFVRATLYVATAIRTEASLSFLGLGVPPPAPSWGNILSEGQSYVRQAPWVTGFSRLAILIAVLAFNLLGDALRDVMDPHLRGEGVRKAE
jgi:ABC-type dipeptide/oligopeptide/nickel transport system permease subunit